MKQIQNRHAQFTAQHTSGQKRTATLYGKMNIEVTEVTENTAAAKQGLSQQIGHLEKKTNEQQAPTIVKIMMNFFGPSK